MDNDITTYDLHINSEVTSRNTPADITKTLVAPGTYVIYEEVIDSKGLRDKSNPINVEVSRGPYIEQSAVLADNGVDIKYFVTLSKVPKAQFKVKKDGVVISTEEISDVNPTGADLDKT